MIVDPVVTTPPPPAVSARLLRASLCLKFAGDILAVADIAAHDALPVAAAAVALADSDLFGIIAPKLCGMTDTGWTP